MAVLVLMIIALMSRFLFLLVGIYSVLINTVFLHMVPTWGGNALSSRIQAAFESASYETSEYFKIYVTGFDIFLLLSYVVTSLLVIFYIFKLLNVSSRIKKRSLVISISAVAISLLVFPTMETLKNFQLVHFPLTVYSTYSQLHVINKRTEYLKTQKKQKLACPNPYEKIVFIQGESVNKNHMSLYGYKKKTTPFLDALKPYVFNAISPTNQTRFSIPIELTNATIKKFKRFYQSPSIVTTLAECGYTTYWISNQGKKGEFDTTITSIAKEADHTFFLNDLDYTTAGLDGNILKTLDSIDTNNDKKQAFFIHLLGSHFAYSDRYPKQAEVFKGDVIAQYDNSVYYTDLIISEIYKRFPNEHSLYIYLSDHAEVVELEEQGHGYSPAYKDEYEIPFVIWSKEAARLPAFFKETKGKQVNTETLNKVIEYLVGKNNTSGASYNKSVMSLEASNIIDYQKLENYKSRNQ